MKSVASSLIVFILILFSLNHIHADVPTGNIKGSVVDPDGKPVSNVHVFLENMNRGDITDKHGLFTIRNLKPGIYTIVIDHISYQRKYIKRIRVQKDQTVDLNKIKLGTQIFQMQSVVVSATKTQRKPVDIPMPVNLVPKIQIQRRNPKTSAEALREETNILVQKTSHGGGCAYIRGLGSNQILLMVDGIRLNNSVYRRGNHSYLTTIDYNMLRRLEVVRGPASALHGSDALGGSVNAVTETPTFRYDDPTFNYEVMGRYASVDYERTLRTEVSYHSRKLALKVGGSLKKFGDLRRGENSAHPKLEKSDLVQSPSGFDANDWNGKLIYSLGLNQKIVLAGQYTKKSHLPRYDKYENNDYYLWEYHPQKRKLGYLRYEANVSKKYLSSLQITIFYQSQEEGRKKQYNIESPIKRERVDVDTRGITIQCNSIFGNHHLTYGSDLYFDKVHSERFIVDPETGESQKKEQARYPDGAKYNRYGLFLQDEFEWDRKWSATVGLRYSYFSTRFSLPEAVFDQKVSQSFESLTGSFGLIHRISNSFYVNANIRQAFRAPNLSDISKLGESKGSIFEVPNPELEPEKMISYDVGFKIDAPCLKASSSIYFAQLSDLIASDYTTYHGSPTIRRHGVDFIVKSKQNIGKAIFWGLETHITYNFYRKLYLHSNLAIPYGQNITKDQPVGGVPPAFGMTGIQWQKRAIFAELFTRFAAKQDRLSSDDMDDPRIPKGGTPGWHTWNIRIGYDVQNVGRFQFSVENIFDLNYREHGSGINAPGRNFVLSAQLNR